MKIHFSGRFWPCSHLLSPFSEPRPCTPSVEALELDSVGPIRLSRWGKHTAPRELAPQIVCPSGTHQDADIFLNSLLPKICKSSAETDQHKDTESNQFSRVTEGSVTGSGACLPGCEAWLGISGPVALGSFLTLFLGLSSLNCKMGMITLAVSHGCCKT